MVVESLELEQWEPGELRGSRRVLRAAEGAVPSADSTVVAIYQLGSGLATAAFSNRVRKSYRPNSDNLILATC